MLALFDGAAIDDHLFVQGAHMVYGWMPTVLSIKYDRLPDALGALRQLQLVEDVPLGPTQWTALAEAVNNSLVGASKLAHFVAPQRAAIWDSKVIRYLVRGHASTARPAIQRRAPHVTSFMRYQSAMRAARGGVRATSLKEKVSGRLGYAVSELRAMELTMFCS